MKHLVAVRANRPHVAAWDDPISFLNFCDRYEMVDMDESLAHVAIGTLKVKAAYSTLATKDSDALSACAGITLIHVHGQGATAALRKPAFIDLRNVLSSVCWRRAFTSGGLE